MLGDRWIYDRVPTERFPDYTRGNAGEVLADPVSPIGWTFCCEPGMVRGCVDGFEQMGVFDALEYDQAWPEAFGLFGGYFYINLSAIRMQGVRNPAATVEVLDTAFFGDHPDVPPYVAHPDDDKPHLVPAIEAGAARAPPTDAGAVASPGVGGACWGTASESSRTQRLARRVAGAGTRTPWRPSRRVDCDRFS